MSRIIKETKEEVEELYQLGLVTDEDYQEVIKLTARDIDIPEPIAYQGQQIVAIRKKLNCSQKVFADILGVTADTISKWERDVRHPEKVACRFLKVLEKEGLEAIN